jgi:DNA polymerase-3 subunit beta
MKTLIENKKFIKILANAQGYLVPRKTTLPIIERVLLKVGEKNIGILSTDLENHLTQTIEVESSDFVKNDGYCVDAKILGSLLSKMASETVMLEYLPTSIKITSQNLEYSLPFLNGKDFPVFTEIKQENSVRFEIGAAVFKNYLTKALPFCGSDESRPVLTSIHFMIKDKIVRVEATDSIKILQANDSIETDIVANINIPSKFATVFNKIYDNETVVIVADNKRIDAIGDRFQFSCRLIEGNYPNTEPLFSDPRETKITFTKTDMLPAIDRLMLFANQTSTGINISINPDFIYMEAADNDFKLSGNERINGHSTNPEKINVGMAGKHLTVCLNAFRSDDITLSVKNSTTALLFEDSNKAVHILIMPIML